MNLIELIADYRELLIEHGRKHACTFLKKMGACKEVREAIFDCFDDEGNALNGLTGEVYTGYSLSL